MKLVSYKTPAHKQRVGLLCDGQVFDLQAGGDACSVTLPSTMREFLRQGERGMQTARFVQRAASEGKLKAVPGKHLSLLSPVPEPTSCRDAYAFRSHVAAARRNRGLQMIAEFDQFPVFYFTNHLAVFGEGDITVESDHLQELDFELECAAVIGKPGKNIPAAQAGSHIAGFMIMNDFSARRLQMEEMKLSLGPAKGKDFATAFGPWLVTPDELQPYRIDGANGVTFDLRMTARHNGRLISDGNLKEMTWTFAEIIDRCSYGVDLHAGDVIGSGTVGTGCYLELNGTRAAQARTKGEAFQPVWLQAGDTIELEITGLGLLRNRIVKAPRDYSILARKKTSPAQTQV
ncbi:MAG TPA: fumarylacetoacetate hydrolase family protein [Candidatus Deferrimicrobium sp.]|nr:fumarylacetoacetate hydrolase family protein [Candidatus Deferrimicrobium sp.]